MYLNINGLRKNRKAKMKTFQYKPEYKCAHLQCPFSDLQTPLHFTIFEALSK